MTIHHGTESFFSVYVNESLVAELLHHQYIEIPNISHILLLVRNLHQDCDCWVALCGLILASKQGWYEPNMSVGGGGQYMGCLAKRYLGSVLQSDIF